MKIFPVTIKRTTVLQGEGAPGGFTGIKFPDSSAAPSDAMAIALSFPDDTLEAQLDALLVGLVAADVTPEQADAFRLAIAGLGDTNAAPSDADAYQFAAAFADDVAAQSDAALLNLLGLGDLNAEQVDTLLLNLQGLGDTNLAPGEALLLAIAGMGDTVSAQSELLNLGFPAPDFSDTSPAPTEGRSFLLRYWLSGSAGAGVTNPTFADAMNNAARAVISTAIAGATSETLTSNVGAGIGTIAFSTAIYRGWFNCTIPLSTGHAILIAHSSSALFTDVTMLDITAAANHDGGTFTFDLVAAGINTLAKLQSLQILHRTTDAAAGVSPAILNVDAGCVEIAGVFS